MAIDFPNAPTNGEEFTAANGITYIFRTAANKWESRGTAPPGVLANTQITGLKLSRPVANEIRVAAGNAFSADGLLQMANPAIINKGQGTFVEGDGNGGLDTGAIADDTLYAVHAIAKAATGQFDILLSLSFTAPTMPAGFDRRRLIAAINMGTSDFLGILQTGNYFLITGLWPQNVDDATSSNKVYKVATLSSCPPDCRADIRGNMKNNADTGETGRIYIQRNGLADQLAADATAFSGHQINGAAFRQNFYSGLVLVDENQMIEWAITRGAGSCEVDIFVAGYEMDTRNEFA